MADETYKRKLTAILSADVAGYSLLMADNELATVAILKSYKETMTSVIQEHNGRVVDAPGDNLLAEFASALDAVNSAVEIQNAISAKNAELSDHPQMQFRIGINIGDVIHEGESIYGDGVNVAARIESLADPGGVCISRSVFDHVKKLQDFGFEYLGEQAVKNITEPVRVYRILADPTAAGQVLGEKRFVGRMSRRGALSVILALGIIAGGLFSYYIYLYQSGRIEPASVDKMALSLPDEPSIAVLPFDNMSGDPEQGYLCDGITEQIIANFSKVSGLFVIARNSSFSFKGKAVKIQQVAEELGVRYVLEGSVQKSGQKVRVTAQLIDAITGHHLWAETYDRELQEAFALQDEITLRILSAVGAELTQGERARVYGKGTNSLAAYSKVVKGYEHFQRQGKEENILARKLAREAIALDPNYPSAYGLLGATYLMDPFAGSTDSSEESWNNGVRAFQKALAIDETHAPSNGGLAMIYGFQRQYEKALAQAKQGMELNPGKPLMHTGYVLVFVGRYEEAVQYFKKAIRYDPKAPTFYYNGLGHAYRGLERYEDAIAAYKKSLERVPNYYIGNVFLTATYSLAGREEEARAQAAKVLSLNPEFSVDRFCKGFPYQEEYLSRLIEGLRMAGLK